MSFKISISLQLIYETKARKFVRVTILNRIEIFFILGEKPEKQSTGKDENIFK